MAIKKSSMVRSERSIKELLKELKGERDNLWETVKEGGANNKFAYIHMYGISNLEEQIKLVEWILKIR